MTISVIGAGSWGTSLAIAARKAENNVTLWGRNPGTAPDGITRTSNWNDLGTSDAALLVTPAQTTREIAKIAHNILPQHCPIILCAKGVERGSLMLLSEVAQEVAPNRALAVLTGPGFAADLTAGKPTAITLACVDTHLGQKLQSTLASSMLRPYLSDDIIGAQIGGAYKNVLAIACGAVMGMQLGESARAALMTRGFAEMTRLGVALGGRAKTLAGLSGLGDLALTCTSSLSRNYQYGFALGATGKEPESGTFEGAATAEAALGLAQKNNVETPICEAVSRIIKHEVTVPQAMQALLSRPLSRES